MFQYGSWKRTIAAAISQQASALDPEGQAAVDAVLEASDKLAEGVRRQLAEPAEPED